MSYWDSRYYGDVLGAAELVLCAGLAMVLLRRFRSPGLRLLFAGMLLLEAASSGIWYLVF